MNYAYTPFPNDKFDTLIILPYKLIKFVLLSLDKKGFKNAKKIRVNRSDEVDALFVEYDMSFDYVLEMIKRGFYRRPLCRVCRKAFSSFLEA